MSAIITRAWKATSLKSGSFFSWGQNQMTTRPTIYNAFCEFQFDLYTGKCAPQRGGSACKAYLRILRRKLHWLVVRSGLSANYMKLLLLRRTRGTDARSLHPDWPQIIQQGRGKEGKCPETMENSNIFQRAKMRVFPRCTLAIFRFLNHILSFLKRTAMKHLGIAHGSILDFVMKTRVCRNHKRGAAY